MEKKRGGVDREGGNCSILHFLTDPLDQFPFLLVLELSAPKRGGSAAQAIMEDETNKKHPTEIHPRLAWPVV